MLFEIAVSSSTEEKLDQIQLCLKYFRSQIEIVMKAIIQKPCHIRRFYLRFLIKMFPFRIFHILRWRGKKTPLNGRNWLFSVETSEIDVVKLDQTEKVIENLVIILQTGLNIYGAKLFFRHFFYISRDFFYDM